VSRRRKRRRHENGSVEKYTRPEAEAELEARRRSDAVLDRNEVERQNALQVAEAADRAGAIVSDEVEAIMGQAEANAESIRRNADRDAHNIREQAVEAASRVAERIDALTNSLGEHAEELRREAEGLHEAAGRRGERRGE
jgi:hypothetical protein